MRFNNTIIALISMSFLHAQTLMNQGVAAFKNGNYPRAVELFQRAVAEDPNSPNPHLYLGTAYMSQWVPGASSVANDAHARSAEIEFKRVLELEPTNQTALASLASLGYNQATPLKGEEKTRKLDEAHDWYNRLLTVDPSNKEAYYSLGVIAWAKWYPEYMKARASLGMKPEDPGPLPSPMREKLRAEYSPMLEEGIRNLDQALLLDPQYDDAMAYKNLLIREQADLRDSTEEYKSDIVVADMWVQRALETKRAKGESGVGGSTSTRIRVGGQVAATNLVNKVEPVYPPLALQARISGQVRFQVVIGKDGTVQNVQLVSGHPLLVVPAQVAVKQYVYRPTLLNGQPVEVITQVDVIFTLP